MELGFVRLTGPGPTLPAGQSPAVGGAEPGPSQKADRARPGTPYGCDEARRNRVVCVWRGRAAVAGAKVS